MTQTYIRDGVAVEMTPEEEAAFEAERAAAAAAAAAAELARVPQVVTMRQARLALFGAGLLDDVDAAINNLSSPQKEAARIEWDFSSAVERDQALVTTLGAALGLSSAQIDALFKTAAGL